MKTGKYVVYIIESEAGWGQRVDSTEYFNDYEEAKTFVKSYNSHNNKKVVPDWYMYANGPYDNETEP